MENSNLKKKDELINIKEIWNGLLKYWYLFIVSFVVCFGVLFVYLKIKNPVYQIYAEVLISEDDKGGKGGSLLSSSLMKGFSFGGMIGGGAVDDEVLVFKTHSLLKEVAEELDLCRTYTERKGLAKKTFYKNSPIVVDVPPMMLDTLSTGLSVKVKVDKKGENIRVKVKDGFFKTLGNVEATSFPVTVETAYGTFVVRPTEYYIPGKKHKFNVSIVGSDLKTEGLRKYLHVALSSKKANGVSLDYQDINVERGKDLLNTMMAIYNRRVLEDKNVSAHATAVFIDSRLESVQRELEEAERRVEKFKKDNNLTDIEVEAKIILENSSKQRQALLEAETQYSVVNMTLEFLSRPENKYALVPVTAGLPSDGAADAVNMYNQLLLQRMRMLRTAKESNISLQTLTAQIDQMRENVLNTVIKAKEYNEIARNDLKAQENLLQNRLKGMPLQERLYMELKRDQLVKDELYIFLLQQKEENNLALAAAVPKGRIIDSAFNLSKPQSPKKMKLAFTTFILALLLPVLFVIIKQMLTVKFEDKHALRKLTNLPIAGELCVSTASDTVVVKEGDTSSIVELFRLLRTNLQFLLTAKDSKVVLLTSSVSGEGKSFISINLAMSLSLLNKKVVLVGLDIRNPRLMDYMKVRSKIGMTSYLASNSMTESEIIVPSTYSPNLDVIFSGPIPPNPSELLLSDRLDHLFAYLREQYDYVIVDSAPVGMVSDTFSLMRITDATLYVCRANYTHKDHIMYVNELVATNKLKNVALVINGTTARQGYGYGYGAHMQKKK